MRGRGAATAGIAFFFFAEPTCCDGGFLPIGEHTGHQHQPLS